jgi:succinate dehydrogenase / fumarate reductase, cytochrome b subunit
MVEAPYLVQIGPAPAVAEIAEPKSHTCGCKARYCPRKFQSVSGVVFGVMMVQHLAVNFLGLWPARYQAAVDRIYGLGGWLPWLSLTLVFLPLAVHIGMGLKLLKGAGLAYQTGKHHRGGDLRYLLQRLSAVILLIFIGLHVLTLHWWGLHQVYRLTGWNSLEAYASSGLFHPADAHASTARAIRTLAGSAGPLAAGNVAVMGLYLLAIWATAYHLANGLSTTAMVWNLTRTPDSEKRLAIFCAGFGIALACVGTLAWCAFTVLA